MASDLLATIREKQAQIAKLQAELDEARSLLNQSPSETIPPNGTQRAKGAAPKGPVKHAVRRRRRRASSVAWAERVLRESDRPDMHADEMVKLIYERLHRRVEKSTLVSSLSRLAKAGETFRRTAPNTFGLLEGAEKPN